MPRTIMPLLNYRRIYKRNKAWRWPHEVFSQGCLYTIFLDAELAPSHAEKDENS
jgi:hypothetical protein